MLLKEFISSLWNRNKVFLSTYVVLRLSASDSAAAWLHALKWCARELPTELVLCFTSYISVSWKINHLTWKMSWYGKRQSAVCWVLVEVKEELVLRHDLVILRRRLHRLILFFKAFNGLIDWNFKFHRYKDTHNYNTRRRNNICKPQSRFWRSGF